MTDFPHVVAYLPLDAIAAQQFDANGIRNGHLTVSDLIDLYLRLRKEHEEILDAARLVREKNIEFSTELTKVKERRQILEKAVTEFADIQAKDARDKTYLSAKVEQLTESLKLAQRNSIKCKNLLDQAGEVEAALIKRIHGREKTIRDLRRILKSKSHRK